MMEECSRKENITAQSLSKQSDSIATSARIQVKQPIPGHDGRDTQRGMDVPCITTSLSGIQCCLFWSLFFSSVAHSIKSLWFSFVMHFTELLRHELIYMVTAACGADHTSTWVDIWPNSMPAACRQVLNTTR